MYIPENHEKIVKTEILTLLLQAVTTHRMHVFKINNDSSNTRP